MCVAFRQNARASNTCAVPRIEALVIEVQKQGNLTNAVCVCVWQPSPFQLAHGSLTYPYVRTRPDHRILAQDVAYHQTRRDSN